MALVCKSLGDVPTGVRTPAEISRGDSTLQVGASEGEQATLKMIQSGYCVACAAGKSALALEPFMHANRPDSTHSLSHALSPTVPTFQDPLQAVQSAISQRWLVRSEVLRPRTVVCVSFKAHRPL